ncbi:MAG: hypothetical protein C0444_09685 [Microbacterium sp.]|nr:hypothetical protein [Microbacterium sp.]MBA4345074.1 hypothetical protein [Microbacterium sp.]
MLIADAVSDPNAIPAGLTIAVSLITGLGGGVLGALIAAKTQRGIARDSRRDAAQHALWSYHRVLYDWSREMESRAIQDAPPYTKSDGEKLGKARDAAYPYRLYLAKDKQELITRNWLPDWRDELGAMGVADDFHAWAKALEDELERVFAKSNR